MSAFDSGEYAEMGTHLQKPSFLSLKMGLEFVFMGRERRKKREKVAGKDGLTGEDEDGGGLAGEDENTLGFGHVRVPLKLNG